jgi:hypothetical protein
MKPPSKDVDTLIREAIALQKARRIEKTVNAIGKLKTDPDTLAAAFLEYLKRNEKKEN